METRGIIPDGRSAFYRAAISIPVSITSSRGRHELVSRNVSTGGMMVLGLHDPLQLLGSLSVSFTLPGQSEKISTNALAIWANAGGAAGLSFTEMDESAAFRLRHWIRNSATEEHGSAKSAMTIP